MLRVVVVNEAAFSYFVQTIPAPHENNAVTMDEQFFPFFHFHELAWHGMAQPCIALHWHFRFAFALGSLEHAVRDVIVFYISSTLFALQLEGAVERASK